MRYIVTKTLNENEVLVTHIDEKKTLDGTMVEVIHGENIFTKDRLINTINDLEEDKSKYEKMLTKENKKALLKNFEEETQAQLDLVNIQLNSLNTMFEEVNKVIS